MIFSQAEGNRNLRAGRDVVKRWRALFSIFFFLSCIPANAFAGERIERIEKQLIEVEQKLEALKAENERLRELMKGVSASEREARDMIDALRKASEALKDSAGAQEAAHRESAVRQPAAIDALRQEDKKIKERLEEVENNNEETALKFSNLVNVSGYADVEHYTTNEPGQNSRFRVRHFSLFFSKRIQDEWELFSELEFEDAPFIESMHTADTAQIVQGKFLTEQMYIKYHPTVDWDLVAGRFLTPAGIWNIYHYPPYVPTQSRPFMVRKIFPLWSDGLQLRKSFSVFDSLLDAHIYIANGAGNPGRLDRNVSKAIGAKLNYFSDMIVNTQLGASYYREKDNLNITRNSYGLHLMLDYHQLGFQTEFALRQNSDPLNAALGNDASAYAQLTYDWAKWTLASRADWYHNSSNALLSLSDSYRYTAAVNYHFAHNVLGKLEYNLNSFNGAKKRFHEIIMSLAVAIGDF
jgi:hypothetical protein